MSQGKLLHFTDHTPNCLECDRNNCIWTEKERALEWWPSWIKARNSDQFGQVVSIHFFKWKIAKVLFFPIPLTDIFRKFSKIRIEIFLDLCSDCSFFFEKNSSELTRNYKYITGYLIFSNYIKLEKKSWSWPGDWEHSIKFGFRLHDGIFPKYFLKCLKISSIVHQ